MPSQGLAEFSELRPQISDAKSLFEHGYHWKGVFAASKVLVNYVKERSEQHQLDGGSRMHSVFSKKSSVLAFNDLKDQADMN
jgi:hypothetical protein